MLDFIGRGANGKVYICKQKNTERFYAVKQCRCDIENIVHIKQSYNHTKKLDHSGIIHYKGLYISPQKRVSHLVMEYFNHPELSSFTFEDEREIADIAYQLLEAVAYIHQAGVCHRDIKPDNILYDRKERKIKLTDFG